MRHLFMAAILVVGILSATSAEAFFWGKKKTESSSEAQTEPVPIPEGYQELDSSMIRAVKYDPASRELSVLFVKGDNYRYEDVPQDVFNRLLSADSKGRFFLEEIKGRYNYKQVK